MRWLNPLKEIFSQPEIVKKTVSAETATAVLLVEVMKMDGKLEPQEEKLLLERLAQHFNLDKEEILKLANEAHTKLDDATDYHQFTRALNQQLSIDEKLALLKSLWMMAAADGHIDAHENHFIRKIADLLHLRQSELIRIKDQVLKSAGMR